MPSPKDNAVPDGHSLASPRYTSDEVLRAEVERIFAPGWHCVGREDMLEEPGRFICARVLAQSVIVTRERGGSLRAFSNYCRHRGMELLEPGSAGKADRFTCPYHAWTYALDGRLIGAPLMHSGFERETLGLRALALCTWRGWVYVSLAPEPAPFSGGLGALDALIAPFEPQAMVTVFTVSDTWQTNWKLLVENFIESYHVFHVHRNTIEPRTPTSSVVCGSGDGSFCYHLLTERPGKRKHDSLNETIAEEYRFIELLCCVFPAQLVSVTANLLIWLGLCPGETGTVHINGGLAARRGYLREGATREEIEKQLRHDFDAFNAEDRSIVERLFQAHRSGGVRPGPLAGLERPIVEFHSYLEKLST